MSSSHRSSKSTKNWSIFVVEASSKLRKIFATYNQLTCRDHNCRYILDVSSPPLYHGSFWPTATYIRFDKRGNILLSFRHWNTCWGSPFLAGNCRRCGQTSVPCRENKSHKKFFSWLCVLVIREIYAPKISRYMVRILNVWRYVRGKITSWVAVRGEGGVTGEARVVGVPKFHSRGKCTKPLTNINSDWMSNSSFGLWNILHYIRQSKQFCVVITPQDMK